MQIGVIAVFLVVVFMVVRVVVAAAARADTPAAASPRMVKTSKLVANLAIKVQNPSVSGAYMSPAPLPVNEGNTWQPCLHRHMIRLFSAGVDKVDV